MDEITSGLADESAETALSLSYVLSLADEDIARIIIMIGRHATDKGIDSWHLEQESLEDVFIRLVKDDATEQEEEQQEE